MSKSQIISSTQEMQQAGAALAEQILQTKNNSAAVVLGLQGELGAGKTTFLQGFAKGLGIVEVVNSPTFVIVKRFRIQESRFKNFYHLDCYRLDNPEDILTLGFAEIIADPENIIAIEWPEKIQKLLPENVISLKFSHDLENQRTLIMD